MDWSTIDFSKSVVRPLKRKRNWSFRICSSLSVPLIVASTMFVYLYLNGLTMTSDHVSDTDTAFLQERRKACASGSESSVRLCFQKLVTKLHGHVVL